MSALAETEYVRRIKGSRSSRRIIGLEGIQDFIKLLNLNLVYTSLGFEKIAWLAKCKSH